MVNKKKEFALELIKFYKEFLIGSSEAVSILAKIEKKYPKEYEILKELKDDPRAITELTKKMSNEEREVFLLIVVEASALGQKINKLFDLTQKEKENLAKEIEDFANRVEKKLSGLIKNAK